MFEKVGNSFFEDIEILYTCYKTNPQTNLFMRLELLEQNSILHTKREMLFSEAKVFMKLLNATRCPWIKRQTLLSYLKHRKKVASLKQDCQLYSNLYVACQNCEEDLEEFFAHENHAYPQSLSI